MKQCLVRECVPCRFARLPDSVFFPVFSHSSCKTKRSLKNNFPHLVRSPALAGRCGFKPGREFALVSILVLQWGRVAWIMNELACLGCPGRERETERGREGERE